jgi:hypothetical protein
MKLSFCLFKLNCSLHAHSLECFNHRPKGGEFVAEGR